MSLDSWRPTYSHSPASRPPRDLSPDTTTPNISSLPQTPRDHEALSVYTPSRDQSLIPRCQPACVGCEVLSFLSAPPSLPSHPHEPKICHSLCCHGKGVLEAILLLGGGGGGGCCCCCCHGGRGPEGGGGGCPLGGGGGGGIMPIGGGGIIPEGRWRRE